MKIPAGVDQDDRIRLTGEGEAGLNGGPAGDLYVVVNLKQHPVFQREGADLHCEMPISFATAALGGELEIPTLDGHATIKIPPETQTGQTFRLRNKGIRPVRGSVHGDLYCHVAVETPIKLTQRQKELLREFEAINAEDPGKHNPRAEGLARQGPRVLRAVGVVGDRASGIEMLRCAMPLPAVCRSDPRRLNPRCLITTSSSSAPAPPA